MTTPVLEERVLLGDEAVALAALHAGISAAYAYPGTPSTEIFEYLHAHAGEHDVRADWCANEKTAYEQALGVSMAGRRSLVSMKHVGLNVAADPFINSALVQIGGGLVVAVADDPGMHSSQNEQDSRYLADFARIICLEPADQQEAYDMTREAFDLSERFHIPVMVRLVTRLCHSRALVRCRSAPGAEPGGQGSRPDRLDAAARRSVAVSGGACWTCNPSCGPLPRDLGVHQAGDANDGGPARGHHHRHRPQLLPGEPRRSGRRCLPTSTSGPIRCPTI